MTISKYRERRESLIEVAQTVTELEATMMLAVMRERFKWQGVIFTRSEVACEWLTQQDDDDEAAAWSDFVETDDETYCTNQGCPSDGPDGSCNHGYCTLAEVWRQPWRIETELSTKSRPKKRPR